MTSNIENTATPEAPPPLSEVQAGLSPERLRLDPELYRDALEELSLSQEQENTLLQALWEIMHIFVEIGWGVQPVQMMIPQLLAQNVLDTSEALEQDEDVPNQGETTTKTKEV
ncbi:MAG: hypothetical protein AAF184_16270 [Pseudomonadota bacterium]